MTQERGSRRKAEGLQPRKHGGQTSPRGRGSVWLPSTCWSHSSDRENLGWEMAQVSLLCKWVWRAPANISQQGLGPGPKEYFTSLPGLDTSERQGAPSPMGSCANRPTHCTCRHSQVLIQGAPSVCLDTQGTPFFPALPPVAKVLFPKPHWSSRTVRLSAWHIQASPVSCVLGRVPGMLACDPRATQTPACPRPGM